MKTWLKRLGLSLLLLIVLIMGAAAILTGTRPGVQWLLEIGNTFAPGELVVAETRGSLLGHLQLKEVSYTDQDMSIQIGELVLNWVPSELLHGIFHLQKLTVDQLRYEKLRETEEAAAEPIELPDIKLPLDLKLDLVQATALEILAAPGSAPIIVDRLTLAAGWTAAGVDLSTLDLAMPGVTFQGQGKVDPRGAYPLDLDVNWQLSMEELPKVSGKGSLKGDTRALQLEHQITGDVQAQLTANARHVLRELGWDTRLKIGKLPPAYLPLDENALLVIELDGKGDLERADAKLVFKVQDGDAPVEAARQLLLNLVASIEFADRQFKLQGDWSDFQWPLTGAPQVEAQSGSLEVSGIPDGYDFSLQSAVQGNGIPPGNWQASGKGDLNKLRLDKLLGNILEGRLEAVGDLSWSPVLAWKMDLTATNIDPEALNAEWPGKLNASISTTGEMPDSGLKLQAQIKELAGSLREKPIAGHGNIQIDGNTLQLEDLAFSSGTARVNASGELGDSWNMAWQLDVADVGDLLPQGEGVIRGAGTLKGSQEQPVVEGVLKIKDALAEGYGCVSCDADFALGLDDRFVSRLRVTGKDLLASGQKVHALSLKLDGPLKQHVLELTADHEQGKLKLVAAGAYLREKMAWDGQVQQLALDAGDIGNWQLKDAASLFASAAEIKLSPLCLQDQQSQLCAQVDRGEDKGNAKLTLKGLSLERLRPWLPPEVTQLTGVLHLDASAELLPVIKGKMAVVLEPGEITYLDPQSKPITMKLHNGKLDAGYDEKQLSARWMLGLGENELHGELSVPREALDKDPLTAPLKGVVKAKITDLDVITALVPDIQKIDGNIDVALTLGGQLGDPRISGHAVVKSNEVLVPRAGLELRDLLVQIIGDGGKRLDISGGVTSGEGKLNLTGTVILDAQQGWPTKLSLKGEQFQLADLPEAQIVITPDIKLESNKELVRIRGRLGIPVARIEIHDLPEGSQDVSSDVVIVNEDGTVDEEVNSKIDAEIVIALGEDVHFKGFGLDADLGGRLTVNQKAGKYPTANGELKIKGGSFRAYGQNLKIEQGRVSYAGGRVDNPGLRLRASRKIDDTTVGVELTGTAKKPDFSTFSSDPDLLEKDVVSMLLTGQKSGDLANAKVYAGKQITKDLSVGVNLGGGSDGSEFVARYRLMDNVDLEGTSSAKKSGASINYTIELE